MLVCRQTCDVGHRPHVEIAHPLVADMSFA